MISSQVVSSQVGKKNTSGKSFLLNYLLLNYYKKYSIKKLFLSLFHPDISPTYRLISIQVW